MNKNFLFILSGLFISPSVGSSTENPRGDITTTTTTTTATTSQNECHISVLFTPDMTESRKTFFLEKTQGMNAQECADFINCGHLFIRSDGNRGSRDRIISHLLSIPKEKRARWGEVIGSFLAPLTSEDETRKMILLSQRFIGNLPRNTTIETLSEFGRLVLKHHEAHPTVSYSDIFVRYKGILQLAKIPALASAPDNLGRLLQFMDEHNLTMEVAYELATIPPNQWEGSLRGIQARIGLAAMQGQSDVQRRVARVRGYGREERERTEREFDDSPPIEGLINQSVHDKETEMGIQSAMEKLQHRYALNRKHSLSEVNAILQNKIRELISQGRLSPKEEGVINLFLSGVGELSTSEKEQFRQYINLVIFSIEDAAAHKELLPNASYTYGDQLDNWRAWFDNAIIDSQLAYLRDLGIKEIPQPEALKKYKSCVGGALNRIIAGLNLLHPDVEVSEGESGIHNMAVYKENADAKRGAEENSVEENSAKKQGDAFVKKQTIGRIKLYLQDHVSSIGQAFIDEWVARGGSLENSEKLQESLADAIQKAVQENVTIGSNNSFDDPVIHQVIQEFIRTFIEYSLEDILETKRKAVD